MLLEGQAPEEDDTIDGDGIPTAANQPVMKSPSCGFDPLGISMFRSAVVIVISVVKTDSH